MNNLIEDAHAVLLPAFEGTSLSDAVRRYLDAGGISILLGESREEYVARKMSDQRRAEETAETFENVTREARGRAGTLLAAVDQELGGICRLHDLVPQFPTRELMVFGTAVEIEEISFQIARQAFSMGVNVFLAPVLDVVTGTNEWLEGRTWSTDPLKIAELSTAYIQGIRRGGVAATAKHFPGFCSTTGDPAVSSTAISLTSKSEIEEGFHVFKAAISAGVEMMMVGPTIVHSLDPREPALCSSSTIDLLKLGLGFAGIVMADDLDSKATLRGDSVSNIAVKSLRAGCDFLLLADCEDQLQLVSDAIVQAVKDGRLDGTSLAASAEKVRKLSRRHDVGVHSHSGDIGKEQL